MRGNQGSTGYAPVMSKAQEIKFEERRLQEYNNKITYINDAVEYLRKKYGI